MSFVFDQYFFIIIGPYIGHFSLSIDAWVLFRFFSLSLFLYLSLFFCHSIKHSLHYFSLVWSRNVWRGRHTGFLSPPNRIIQYCLLKLGENHHFEAISLSIQIPAMSEKQNSKSAEMSTTQISGLKMSEFCQYIRMYPNQIIPRSLWTFHCSSLSTKWNIRLKV